MQIGVDSFVAATVDAAGRAVDPARHLSELLEAITLAEEVGLDVFGIGEHHRREFLDSAQTVILAAAAVRSERDDRMQVLGQPPVPLRMGQTVSVAMTRSIESGGRPDSNEIASSR